MKALVAEGGRLGRYELIRRLATGGMAEVWLARATGVEGFTKDIVVKTILPHHAEDPSFVRMFVNEALLAAGLSHPNIVQIFDLGSCSNTYYIAMEYISGRTLRQVKRACSKQGSPPPLWLVLKVALAVCDALDYAHGRCGEDGHPLGIVHRDVTPENIMISQVGVTKVLDFGIAKASSIANNTEVGQLKGKFAYLAPEQILGASQGKPLDGRVDLFALGVVLYEMLTGVRPFKSETNLGLLKAILEQAPPPISTPDPEDAPELNAIVQKALAKDPAKRHQSAHELRAELEAFILARRLTRPERFVGSYLRELFTEQDSNRGKVPVGSGVHAVPPEQPVAAAPVILPRAPLPPPPPPPPPLPQQARSAARAAARARPAQVAPPKKSSEPTAKKSSRPPSPGSDPPTVQVDAREPEPEKVAAKAPLTLTPSPPPVFHLPRPTTSTTAASSPALPRPQSNQAACGKKASAERDLPEAKTAAPSPKAALPTPKSAMRTPETVTPSPARDSSAGTTGGHGGGDGPASDSEATQPTPWDRIVSRARADQADETPSSQPSSSRPSALPTPIGWDAYLQRAASSEPPDEQGPTVGAASAQRRHAWDAVLDTSSSVDHSPAPGARREPPGSAAEQFDRGLALLRAGDHDGARAAWKSAVALEPDNRRYRINLRRLEQLTNETTEID